MTERLYDISGYIKEFYANVVDCLALDGKTAVVLDRTSFFPEQGGQYGDTGYIENIRVCDTQIKNGIIYHYVDAPIAKNTVVHCKIDWEMRFERMQNHSAEHIVSGIVCRAYACNNIGFHLGEGFVTMDYDRVLEKRDIDAVELLANRAVMQNIGIHAYFPESVEKKEYRSKKEIKEKIRIVEIEGVDVCACCAPHVKATGEIGLIKLLSFSKNKGGTRIVMKAGLWALNEFNAYEDNLQKIAEMVSLPREETAGGVERLKKQLEQSGEMLRKYELEIIKNAVQSNGKRYMLVSEPSLLKDCANELFKKHKSTVCAFCGDDENGYRFFALTDKSLDELKEKMKAINALGGGRDNMLQGMARTTAASIETLFEA